ncbi:cupin domain-containing protein [Paenirhodobacter sp. CAU 1674]|uniref:cupin domain-containing protein n=1 Tax=Paenirhodobacter sp. CAU 1674 TaxID=3032596 RepID=UPI0023DCC209|nr:cupin domain-containing protein [Paenirhodobacter sp. CAU 1674]MDF2140759.1 cupin domain-containing protein [Paenirhodobacter sp. CAU 1674]
MLLQALTPAATDPETSRPDPEKLISGDPVHTTWNVEDDRGLYCGIWQSTPGAWRCSYDEWEYCRILSGRAVITGDDGSRLEVGPGDSFILRPGFSGRWEVLETIRKDYVILFR